MTGWRIGWVLGPRALVDACTALISHSTQCPATFAQVGAVEALTGPQKFVQDLLAEYQRRRDFVHPALAAIPGVTCVRARRRVLRVPQCRRAISRLGARTPCAWACASSRRRRWRSCRARDLAPPATCAISFARPMDELKEGVRRIATFLAGLRGD